MTLYVHLRKAVLDAQGVPQKKIKALGQGEGAGGGVTTFRMSKFFEKVVPE